MNIPCALVNFVVYNDAEMMVGVANVSLPDISFLTTQATGAGISGNIDIPIIGQTESLNMTIEWTNLVNETGKFLAPKFHTLTLRGTIENLNDVTGDLELYNVKVLAKCMPKNMKMGKFEAGNGTGSSSEFELSYIKMEIDGNNLYEIDKLNSKFVVDGTDYLKSVRQNLGLS